MSLDGSQCPALEGIPGKVSGAWALKGTGVPSKAHLENPGAGRPAFGGVGLGHEPL